MEASDKLEVKRQLFHLFLGLFISFFVFYLKPIFEELVIIPFILAVIFLLLVPKIIPEMKVTNHLIYHFEREQDRENFPFKGAIFYGMGIIPAILLLELNLACAIIAVLSAGDAMSTLIGRFYGKIRKGHKTKSLEGFFAFILFGFMGAAIFVSPQLALMLAILGGFIEFFTFIDDNFLVPVGLTILYKISGF